VFRFVAFLRAINVGGHTVTMEMLRRQFSSLGFKDVETFIASGNVIFTSSGKDESALRRKIEGRLLNALGYEVRTFLRTDSEVGGVARYAPFTPARIASARTLCVVFLAEPPSPAAKKALMAHRSDADDFHVNGRDVYWLCQVGQSESPFATKAGFEKTLKMPGTVRGMKTMMKLTARFGL
jgi:uncharacterized protein (DUF1697 family)